MIATRYTFLRIAQSLVGGRHGWIDSRERDFRAMFGISVGSAVFIWNLLHFDSIPKLRPKHFLWGQMTLKLYTNQTVMASIAKATRKTFRKWAYRSIRILSNSAGDVVSYILVAINNCVKTTLTLTITGVDTMGQQIPRRSWENMLSHRQWNRFLHSRAWESYRSSLVSQENRQTLDL